MLGVMPRLSVFKHPEKRWRYWGQTPPSKRQKYALRLWATREYRMLTAEELGGLSGVNVKEVNRLQSTPTDDPPDQEDLVRLDALALALAVDPAWLRGDDTARAFDHGGIAVVLRHGYMRLRAMEAEERRQAQPPPQPDLHKPSDLDDTGMQPAQRQPFLRSIGRPLSDITPALNWIAQVNDAWMTDTAARRSERFLGRLRTWHHGLSPQERRQIEVQRHRVVAPDSFLGSIHPIYKLLPADLLLGCGAAILPGEQVPDHDDVRDALTWMMAGWYEPRSPFIPAPPTWRDGLAAAHLVPDTALAAIRQSSTYQACVQAATLAWDEALGHIDRAHPDAIALRAAVDARMQGLLRWAVATPFPGDQPLDIDQAVSLYREFRKFMRRDSSEAIDQGDALPRRESSDATDQADMLPRRIVDLLEATEGRIIDTATFNQTVRSIGASERPAVSEQDLLDALRQGRYIADVPVDKQYEGAVVIVLDEDDRRFRRETGKAT